MLQRARSTAVQVSVCALLVVATLAVYRPAFDFGWVNFDDPGYVAANPDVQRGLDPRGVVWAFTTGRTANWIPLTWLSYMLDVELFGLDPGAMHAVNVALHAVNALLLHLFLVRTTGAAAPSAVVAAAFALHPLRVESVAWISERKDVLCALFALATLSAYASWVRRGGALRYAAVLVLLALGLLAKPMLVTLPFVLLLLDAWPLGRTALAPPAVPVRRVHPARTLRLVAEKIPLFVLVVASSVVTLLVQRAGGAVADPLVLPLGARLAGAVVAYARYLELTLWPAGLAALYPNPALVGGTLPAWQVAASAALLVAVSALALAAARRAPYLAVGWLWFVGMLVPVIGLVQVGQQAMADRYTYLPSIGVLLMIAFGGAELSRRLRLPRAVPAAASAAALLALAAASRHQLWFWRDSVALAERALSVTTGNYVMHFNLASALAERGDLGGAVKHYRAAARLRPDLASFRLNLGAALIAAGRVEEGAAEYRVAMALAPRDPAAASNLAWLRATHPDARHRNGAEALAAARRSVRLRGADDAAALDVLAAALAESGDFAAAARRARGALARARAAGDEAAAREIEARLVLYRAGRAYREPAAPTRAPARTPPAGDHST